MGGIIWSELFPTKTSIFIFISYMSLFVSQGILVTASQGADNSYKYNTVTVVLLTEVLKLIVSGSLYCRQHTFKSLIENIVNGINVLLLYFVPAFLYCLYNNLSFINLSVFDPTTYFLLLQFRVVITGILFQIIFKKYLSRIQWLSLILLTVGCMIKQINFGDITINENNIGNNKTMNGLKLNINIIFILIQTVCSCLAGVYNEYLLKNKGNNINIYIQNIFMYIDSIVCNLIILLLQGNFMNSFSANNLSIIFNFNIIIIMINNTAIGIITSFFLKYMNSILKTFASSLEILLTAVLCYIIFSIPIYINTILSIIIVTISIYIYSKSPVNNTVMKVNNKQNDEELLLNNSDTEDDNDDDDDDEDDDSVNIDGIYDNHFKQKIENV